MTSYLRRYLEHLIARHGLVRVVLAPYSLVPVLSALGVVFDVRLAILLGCASLAMASLFAVAGILRQLHASRETVRDLEKVANDYADIILSSRVMPFRHDQWEEYITVRRDGDATIEQFLAIRVVKKTKPVQVIWVRQHQSSRNPLSARQQQKVDVEVRHFSPYAEHGRRLGAKHVTTKRWEAGGKLCVMVHLQEPLPYDGVAYIHLRWVWPGYFRELVRGGRDVIDWSVRGRIGNLVCSLTFKPECKLRAGIDVTPYIGTPAPRCHVDRDGEVKIDLDYKEMSGATRLGLHLDATRNRY